MGYPVASANLSQYAERPAELVARCKRLQTEMDLWLRGAPRIKAEFNGTFESLISIYETDPESSFHENKPGVKKSYLVYIRRLKGHIGGLRIDECDGTDAKRWFREWRLDEKTGKDRLPRARFVLAVLKAAISFGVARRLPGVRDFQAALAEIEFPGLKARTFAPTAKQIIAARMAAHEAGAPHRALVYSLQFETTLRQWDIIGIWVPLSERLPSSIHDGGKKWIGPMWSAIDENGIIKIRPTKTEHTTAVEVLFDLTVCPMVQEDLAKIPQDQRIGPLVVNQDTGLPYSYQKFNEAWRADFRAAGLPVGLWNRDFRAGGVTEGGRSGASKDDRRKLAGHAREDTTDIYDRDMIEAHRRVMAARTSHRKNER
jgi:hypothetical protein